MIPTPGTVSAALQGLAVALYAGCQAALVGYSAHRWLMLADRASEPETPARWWRPGEEPHVLVQLPVLDEPAVVERLLVTAAALDWPRDRLEIQLLDDSDAAATAIGARAVARIRGTGAWVHHVRRDHRRGFKAGALAEGLAKSDADYVTVFDADFVPSADFLRRALPHFADARVGLVQACWGHLNRNASLLTRAQATMLDAHLLVEHEWRQRTGRFLNFNGTAGVWRRACIDDAGGWSHDTLTEDLDLSYRAQLAGWRFAFDRTLVVPAELPEGMEAFRSQQHRWAKGALQTARKLLPRVARAPLPWHVKQEAFVHLTANVTYPLLLALALLLFPMLRVSSTRPASWMLALHVFVVAAGTLPMALFLVRGQQLAGQRGLRVAVDVAAALLLCAGLSWHLACAVGEGLWGATGEFVRTPKTGAGANLAKRGSLSGPAQRRRQSIFAGLPERVLAGAFAGLAVWASASGRPVAAPFLLSLAAGLGWVGLAPRRGAAPVQRPGN